MRRSLVHGLYDPDNYSASQRFAREHRNSERGLAYASVRAVEGTCVVGFLPETVRDLKHHHQVVMSWDGSRMTI